MKELPSREPRSPAEQFADAQALQAYMKGSGKEKPVKYILEGESWVPVPLGDKDYEKALGDRYDENGMPLGPWEPDYWGASVTRPKAV